MLNYFLKYISLITIHIKGKIIFFIFYFILSTITKQDKNIIILSCTLPSNRGEQKNQETEKKNPKKPNRKKNPIKPINFFPKMFGSVRFRFQKPETGKTPTEPNRFDLRGTINTKKIASVFLTLTSILDTSAVLLLLLLLSRSQLPQLTVS